jgi:hypothetical protein
MEKITNFDVICFYLDKKEHYPISDEFIKQYQQKSTGKYSYISYALNTGHLISESSAEPNQKWHLLEAYFLNKIKENGVEYLEKPTDCYRILCPELLLWMAEAAGVSSQVINIASKIAKTEIDKIRTSQKADSASAVRKMNKELRKLYDGKCLWDFIADKINSWKKININGRILSFG